jgi:hypothetical protein
MNLRAKIIWDEFNKKIKRLSDNHEIKLKIQTHNWINVNDNTFYSYRRSAMHNLALALQ